MGLFGYIRKRTKRANASMNYNGYNGCDPRPDERRDDEQRQDETRRLEEHLRDDVRRYESDLRELAET
jgi:hypothetical protein